MSGKLVTGKHALVRPFFQDGKDKRYSYVYTRILYICIFFLLAVLEVKNVQEHASLLHLLAMSKINKLLAQELGTATCLIARRIGQDKSADKCQRWDKVKGRLSATVNHHPQPKKRYDC